LIDTYQYQHIFDITDDVICMIIVIELSKDVMIICSSGNNQAARKAATIAYLQTKKNRASTQLEGLSVVVIAWCCVLCMFLLCFLRVVNEGIFSTVRRPLFFLP
jgi:hypothetical protein